MASCDLNQDYAVANIGALGGAFQQGLGALTTTTTTSTGTGDVLYFNGTDNQQMWYSGYGQLQAQPAQAFISPPLGQGLADIMDSRPKRFVDKLRCEIDNWHGNVLNKEG